MLLSSVGMMGEVVVLGWLALELTNSPFLVGLAMSARALPLFFVGAPAGVLADRVPRHQLLVATGVGQALSTAALGSITLAGRVSFTHLFVFTLASGVLRGVEHAARQSYTHDVAGAEGLVRGLAIQGLAMRCGWFAGSLGSGAMIANLGPGPAYIGVGIAYLVGTLPLVGASPPVRTAPPERESLWRAVGEFVDGVRKDRTLFVIMVLTAGAEVLGFSHQAVLPSLARDVLRTGPEGLGVLNGARSVGGFFGLVASMGGSGQRVGQSGGALFLAILVIFGASVVALGVSPYAVGFAGVVVVLLVTNAAGAIADLLAQSLLQRSVPAHLRGRAGGAWVVAIGLAPLGQLQIGGLASLVGVSAALGASGLALVGLVAATALAYPRLRRL
jgi:MFS family permease